MKGEYVVIENYAQEVEPSIMTDAMLEACILHFFGRYQDAHQPVEPVEPLLPTERPWKTYTITGFHGISPRCGCYYFMLPDKEQVPCANVGEYGCEHWVNSAVMTPGGIVVCDSCHKRDRE